MKVCKTCGLPDQGSVPMGTVIALCQCRWNLPNQNTEARIAELEAQKNNIVENGLYLSAELRKRIAELESERDELLEALEQMVSIAERVDGWESFPSAPIEVALKAIAKAKGKK
jgi:hypothetical protein